MTDKRISLKFLQPRLSNCLFTFIILSLPIIPERIPLVTGGYESVRYIPMFLLYAYLQMGDYYLFILMVGFLLLVFFVVSLIIAVILKFSKKIQGGNHGGAKSSRTIESK